MLSQTKPILMQSLLYDDHLSNATSNNFFLSLKWKKLLKTTSAKLYLVKKWEAMHKKFYIYI